MIWRSRPGGHVGFVLAGFVLFDTEDGQAIVQPTGSDIARRGGNRGGPGGRSLLPGGWDGTHDVDSWSGPPSVRLHPAGKPYAVFRQWLPDPNRFHGWYVNPEQPWTRTSLGFDGGDLILDVTVADDLSMWALKDEDELDWSLEVGKITLDEHAAAHAAAAAAIADLEARAWPFDEAAWPVVPGDLLRPATLPVGWDRP